jgi:methyl-accepting chemotaxis protein
MPNILKPEDNSSNFTQTFKNTSSIRSGGKTSARKQALIEKLASISQEVASSVEEISAAITQAGRSAHSIAGAAEEAARNSESNRKAVQNLQTLITDNLGNSKIVQDKTVDIQTQFTAIIKNIKSLNKSIEESVGGIEKSLGVVEVIEEVAKDVEEAVKGIMSIADKTNLLALNAAIEAAKAEEHGKGFSVVAEEVRVLTEMSEENATLIQNVLKDLLGQIHGIVDQAKTTVQDGKQQLVVANETSAKVNESQDNVQKVAVIANQFTTLYQSSTNHIDNLMRGSEQVAAAAEEQSSAAEQINSSTEQLSTVINQIGTAAEELRAMSQELSESINIDTKAADQIAVAAEELSSSVEEMIRTQGQIRQSINQLASTAEEQARAAEGMNSMTKELLDSANQIVIGSDKAIEGADKTNESTAASKEMLSDIAIGIDASVKNLDASTKRLHELKKNADIINIAVGKLDLVMVQINMLSVNGFVEAARSGEFGKGFEVVSGDIKTLSSNGFDNIEILKKKLRDVIEQIDQLSSQLGISSTRAASEVERSNDLAEQFDAIVESSEDIKEQNVKGGRDAVVMKSDSQGILTAAEQIAGAAEETARTTQELDKAASQIAQASSQLSQAVTELAAIADELQNL